MISLTRSVSFSSLSLQLIKRSSNPLSLFLSFFTTFSLPISLSSQLSFSQFNPIYCTRVPFPILIISSLFSSFIHFPSLSSLSLPLLLFRSSFRYFLFLFSHSLSSSYSFLFNHRLQLANYQLNSRSVANCSPFLFLSTLFLSLFLSLSLVFSLNSFSLSFHRSFKRLTKYYSSPKGSNFPYSTVIIMLLILKKERERMREREKNS